MRLEKLGKERDQLRKRITQAKTLARHAKDPSVSRSDLTAAYLAASLLGWGTQQRWATNLLDPEKDTLRQMLRRAQVYAERSSSGLGVIADVQALAAVDLAADRALYSAVAQGYETGSRDAAETAAPRLEYKTWVRIYPVREPRDWHVTLEGTTIPYDDLFSLPGGPNAGTDVTGPHDWASLPDPAEWMNCGHALVYTEES